MFRSVSCIQVCHAEDADLGAERNDGDRNQRDRDRQERRQQIEELVDVRRNQVFLGDQLDDVGQRLQQPVRSHRARPDAHLDVRDHLALDPLQVGQRGHEHKRDDRGFDEGDDEEIHGSCQCQLSVVSRTESSADLHGASKCRLHHHDSGASTTEFSIFEYRPSVPDVKSVSCSKTDQIGPWPLRHAPVDRHGLRRSAVSGSAGNVVAVHGLANLVETLSASRCPGRSAHFLARSGP